MKSPKWFNDAIRKADDEETDPQVWQDRIWEAVAAQMQDVDADALRHEVKQLRQAVTLAVYALERALPHDDT